MPPRSTATNGFVYRAFNNAEFAKLVEALDDDGSQIKVNGYHEL